MKQSLKFIVLSFSICLGIISGAIVSKLASSAETKPVPLIFDDDGMTALAYMLQNPKFSVNTNTSPETTQGQTLEIPKRSPNVRACLNPNIAKINPRELFRKTSP